MAGEASDDWRAGQAAASAAAGKGGGQAVARLIGGSARSAKQAKSGGTLRRKVDKESVKRVHYKAGTERSNGMY